jgi:hypothetical protein
MVQYDCVVIVASDGEGEYMDVFELTEKNLVDIVNQYQIACYMELVPSLEDMKVALNLSQNALHAVAWISGRQCKIFHTDQCGIDVTDTEGVNDVPLTV